MCFLPLHKGLEYQRPKHPISSSDIEVASTGTPLQQESPELYRKGTTPSDLTPDDSPLQSFPASPTATPPPAPASRNKVAHFSRQVSVDEERGGDIQMLLEGRGGDYARNSWGEEKAGGSRGIRGSTLRSSQPTDDFRCRGPGHKQPGNPKSRERRTESPPTFSWTSHHRAGNPGCGAAQLLELEEEKLSNYELEMKPLRRMDSYVQEAQPQKRRHSKGGACRGLGDDPRADDRGFGAQRLRSKSQNKDSTRPAPCAEPAVQRLESLRLGDRAEPRLLRWDLAFSPPQKSSPVALESDEENGDELKSSTVSPHWPLAAGSALLPPAEGGLGGAGGGGSFPRKGSLPLEASVGDGVPPSFRAKGGLLPGLILAANALGWSRSSQKKRGCSGIPFPAHTPPAPGGSTPALVRKPRYHRVQGQSRVLEKSTEGQPEPLGHQAGDQLRTVLSRPYLLTWGPGTGSSHDAHSHGQGGQRIKLCEGRPGQGFPPYQSCSSLHVA